ncbi:MATE family efflux transporter [Paracoccus aminophilus]|uniref:MATE efflux family protein n=1 Tax=Paracoccus aminophilus JCM 7686 TaxID=1367847 RepID=S5Y016_PARAH|nr:MATE family efflux transporter [Paracoccus aminophilus]AGT09030.1 MATE efflux family protein [Paracoccus aminophilus JCM 7686]
MQTTTSLTTAPIGRTLLLFALPTLLSSMLQSANGSIDAVWVGRLLGEGALAATTNGNLVMFLLTAFIFGFGMAATILIGQAVGRRDIQGAREVVGTAIGAFIPISILISVIGWFLAPRVLLLLGTPAEIVPLADAFLRVTFLAMPAILMLTMLMMALRGSGDAITPLIFMGLAVVLDVVLNPVFILGLGPVPQMGIGGSAFATAIANFLALFAMLGYIYARDLPLRLRGAELRYLIPAPHILALLFSKGLPMGIQMIVVSSSMLTMMNMVNAEGVATAAAFGATQQLWTYVQMPAMALGAAVSTMAAQNIGAGRWDRVSQITRSGILFTVALTGALVVVLLFADRQAMAIFLGANSPAIPIGQHIGMLSTWGFIAFGITMVFFGTVRANGQVIWPVIILFISLYPIRIGFAYGLRPWLGTDALWLSFPAAMIATMLMATALYRHGGWRKMAPMTITAPETAAPNLATPSLAVTTEAAPPGSGLAPQTAHLSRESR